jgi:hypothetical protein
LNKSLYSAVGLLADKKINTLIIGQRRELRRMPVLLNGTTMPSKIPPYGNSDKK